MALTAAAYLDDLLVTPLRAALLDNSGTNELLDGYNAPLGTLASRISAAFALGLISENERRTANLIWKIRNECAHTLKASFSTEPLAGLCGELTKSSRADLEEKNRDEHYPRTEFKWCALNFLYQISQLDPASVKLHKLELRDWMAMNNKHYGIGTWDGLAGTFGRAGLLRR